MMPGLLGLKVMVTLPFLPVFTVFVIPAPVILTLAPPTPLPAFVTLTVTFCDLPFPFRTFGVTVSSSQTSGVGLGFGVGGVTGAVTTVEAEAVLLFGFVSGGVVLLITTTFVFVPVALTVALIVIGTDSPTARLEMMQSTAWAVVVQVPFPVVAEMNVTSAGAASDTCTFSAGSGPLFLAAML